MKDLVLVGGGHAHAEVLRRFGKHPPDGARLTFINPGRYLTYAPMFAGYVAGLYRFDQVHIDLAALAKRAGAEVVYGSLESLDLAGRRLEVSGHAPIAFDVLSLNSGAFPRYSDIPGVPDHVLPIRPFQHFLSGWTDVRLRALASKGKFVIVVVGAGVGGVELILAMQQRLRQDLLARGDHPSRLEFTLVTNEQTVLTELPVAARQRLITLLRERGVRILTKHSVTEVRKGSVLASHHPEVTGDVIVWAASLEGPVWAQRSGLNTDARGFIRVGPDLQSVSHLGIFAAGDLASFPQQRDRSVVCSLAQGKALARNLRAALQERTPYHFHARAQRLYRIATGDRSAVALLGERAFQGRWVWWTKDWADRKFTRRYRILRSRKWTVGPS
jgi:selenide,water dikinase